MLGSMKSVKSLGLGEAVASQIRNLRISEINQSKKVRWMAVIYNASGKRLIVSLYMVLTPFSFDHECLGAKYASQQMP